MTPEPVKRKVEGGVAWTHPFQWGEQIFWLRMDDFKKAKGWTDGDVEETDMTQAAFINAKAVLVEDAPPDPWLAQSTQDEETSARPLNFSLDATDATQIYDIADRAVDLLKFSRDPERRRYEVILDLAAIHLNHARLDLRALLEADELTFLHELRSLQRYLNRDTGRLMSSREFAPRFFLTETPTENA